MPSIIIADTWVCCAQTGILTVLLYYRPVLFDIEMSFKGRQSQSRDILSYVWAVREQTELVDANMYLGSYFF